MASLLDIAPARETVTVSGVALEVRGISAEQIVALMQRFGNVFTILAGDKTAAPIAVNPAIGAVIAAATGMPGDEAAEKVAADLPLGDQAELLAAVRRLTMPKGVRPFLQALADLGLPLGAVLSSLDSAEAAALAGTPASPNPSPAASSS